MAAVCRVLFVCSLCLAWCGVVMATKGTQGDEAIEKIKEKAIEGFYRSDVAMAWQGAVVANATSLLSSLEEVSEAIKVAEGEEQSSLEKLPPKAKTAVDSLLKTINDAKEAAQRVTTIDNTSLKAEDIKKVTRVFYEKITPVSGVAMDENEIKRLVGRAAGLWEEAATFFEFQFSAAQAAASKTEAAAKALSDAVEALSTETEASTQGMKDKVDKAKAKLDSAVNDALLMREAAEEVKKKAQEALKTLREVAGPSTAPNDMHEPKEKEKKTPGRNNMNDKSTGSTDERSEKGTATEDTTADDTTNVESTNRQLQEDSSFFSFTFLQVSHLIALLVFLFLLI